MAEYGLLAVRGATLFLLQQKGFLFIDTDKPR